MLLTKSVNLKHFSLKTKHTIHTNNSFNFIIVNKSNSWLINALFKIYLLKIIEKIKILMLTNKSWSSFSFVVKKTLILLIRLKACFLSSKFLSCNPWFFFYFCIINNLIKIFLSAFSLRYSISRRANLCVFLFSSSKSFLYI